MKIFTRRMEWRHLAAHTGLLTLASVLLSLPASAAAGGQALPWEAPLTRLQQSLSGPVAGAIAVIALVAIGVTLVFGGEWNEFARALRWFSDGRTTRGTISRVGEPAAIVDGRGPGIDFGLRYPGSDVGFCGDEVVEHSCRTRSMADRGWNSRAHGQGGPPLASRLYSAHSLSGFLSRQEPDVRSSHYDPRKLEMNHAPY